MTATVATAALLACAGCSSGSAVVLPGSTASSSAEVTSSDASVAPSGSAAPSGSTTRTATITKIATTPTAAAASLLKAGITVKGTPGGALAWRDENALNILLVSVEQTSSTAVEGSTTTTTRAYLASGLDQADGGRLRDQIVESHEPCSNDGGSEAVPSSFTVTDQDGDGHADATAGWTWSCRGDPGPIQVKLTTFSRGKHYQLTGEGQERSNPLPSPFDQGLAAVTATPTPAKAQWPAGLYDPSVVLFFTLYL